MLIRLRQFGFTLIELLIGIVVVSILLFLAAPTFTLFLQNTQIRTAAESVQNGLQLARAEAVRKNTQIDFQLTSVTGRVDWALGCPAIAVTVDCPAAIQSKTGAEGTTNARVGVATTATPFTTLIPVAAAATTISFNGLGRLIQPGIPVLAAGTSIRIDVTQPAMANTRRLVVLVTTGGRIRMCDPALTLASNAQGCI